MIKKFIGIGKINSVNAAIALIILINQFTGSSLDRQGAVELIILCTKWNQSRTGSPMFKKLSGNDKSPESNVRRLIGREVHPRSVIIDNGPSHADLSEKNLVAESTE